MTKNATLPVEQQFIDEALDKHKKILTETHTDPIDDETYDRVTRSIDRVASEVFGHVHTPRPVPRVFTNPEDTYNMQGPGFTVRHDRQPPSRLPSFGASFSSQRSKGGAAGEILKYIDYDEDLVEPIGGYLYGFACHPHRFGPVMEVRTYRDPALYYQAERDSYEIAHIFWGS